MHTRNDHAWYRLLASLALGLTLALALIWLVASVRTPGVQAASPLSPAITGQGMVTPGEEAPPADGITEAMAGGPGALGDGRDLPAGIGLLALNDATPDWSAEGEPGTSLGYSVASAGDVNGDGYADLVVGAPDFTGTTDRAYVFQGGASGLSATPTLTLTHESVDDRFGYSVASAGDVNGDGYADLVIGSPGYYTHTGRVWVYHGASGGLSATPTLTLTGEITWSLFGQSVAPAGDVNGDGYADLVVGAVGYDENRGRAYVYHGGAGGLNASPALTLTGEVTGISFGQSAASAGDVNGDGYADVVVGAHDYDAGRGRAYVYHGGAGGLNATPALTLTGEAPQNLFGFSVASAGDVNGDGYADLVVGANSYQANRGRAYLYHGAAGGLSATPALTLTGEGLYRFGRCVASARDVNGDGYADVVVGVPGHNQGVGQAYVYQGGAGGLSATPAFTLSGQGTWSDFGSSVASAGDVNGDGYADVAIGAPAINSYTLSRAFAYYGAAGGPSASPAFTASGRSDGDWLGYALAGAGDVNGDGQADILVAAPHAADDKGQAYLYLGEGAGLSAGPAFTASGRLAGDWLGYSLAGAGDVNGDGYADVLVGAPGAPGGSMQGQAYLYLGEGAGLSASPAFTASGRSDGDWLGYSVAGVGDVNGDGYADVLVGAPRAPAGTEKGQAYLYLGGSAGLSTTPAFTVTGQTDHDSLGQSVAGAGDVNGDGYADVLIGAPYVDAGGTDRGQAYLYLGGSAGLSVRPAFTASGGADLHRVGWSVAGAGDVNRDGYADVLLGAPYVGGMSHTGQVQLHLGGSAGLSTTPAFSATGADASWFGYSVAGAGDVNGDGYADVLVGSPFIDTSGEYEGQAYLYLGEGAGLVSTPAFTASGGAGDEFGRSVAGAGDVNGDSYADVLVGAPGAAGATWKGQAYLHLANGAGGRGVLARHMRGDGSASQVQPWGLSHAEDAFRLRLTATDPMGRGRVKLQAQACPPGVAFGDTACLEHTSAAWTDVTASGPGVTLEETMSGLASGELYRWRARVLYAPLHVTQAGITPPPNPAHGPWRRFLGQTFEADLRTGLPTAPDTGYRLYLPLMIRE